MQASCTFLYLVPAGTLPPSLLLEGHEGVHDLPQDHNPPILHRTTDSNPFVTQWYPEPGTCLDIHILCIQTTDRLYLRNSRNPFQSVLNNKISTTIYYLPSSILRSRVVSIILCTTNKIKFSRYVPSQRHSNKIPNKHYHIKLKRTISKSQCTEELVKPFPNSTKTRTGQM